ncbi:hypothetical protein M407DRAFT_6822 [Tulasnella calospora MUT 4182]|uniref:DUF7770 domain-containing protein n=1 Tax=Tulasnella calospora MUT 4182 TaxID=1051891 RepID=A0A0C3M438_9AGAM|nr:hypothetical protein M407DRAFT_6822 [Tulasnella calospora MUT 4182]
MDVAAITSYITTNGNWGHNGFQAPNTSRYHLRNSRVNFIAHANPENQGEDGQPPTNHWMMILVTVDASPVHIDVIPAGESSPAMLVIEHQELQTIDRAYVVPLGVKERTTVADIHLVIIQKGRDR